MAQQQEQISLVFHDIRIGTLEAVQQRVPADATVLEEREWALQRTPLMWAIKCKRPAIAFWIIQHRGQHDINTANNAGSTALHYASGSGLLEVVQALWRRALIRQLFLD